MADMNFLGKAVEMGEWLLRGMNWTEDDLTDFDLKMCSMVTYGMNLGMTVTEDKEVNDLIVATVYSLNQCYGLTKDSAKDMTIYSHNNYKEDDVCTLAVNTGLGLYKDYLKDDNSNVFDTIMHMYLEMKELIDRK